MQAIVILLGLVLPFLLVETWWSARNEARLRERGAVEPRDDVYAWMRIVYPGMFLAMAIEGLVRGPADTRLLAAGATVFLGAKLLKWWAILTLGSLWSFRVLVVPGAPLIATGPYRFLRHPNYVGLAGEAIGAAMLWQAPIAGLIGGLAFGALVWRRIAVEEAALGLRK